MKKLCAIILAAMLVCASITAFANGILPTMDDILGVTVPNAAYALGREADSTVQTADGGTTLTFENCTAAEYDQLDRYLTAAGGTSEAAEAGQAVTINVNGVELSLQYDYTTKTLTLTYPTGTRFEKEAGDCAEEGKLLPSLETYLINLPNLQTILNRAPSESNIENGELTQTYAGFTDDDYNTFSLWLDGSDCGVSDYTVDGNVISFRLQKGDTEFDFVYDRGGSTATITYPDGARPEPTPEPTVAPTATPKPQSKSSNNYSSGKSTYECEQIAKNYFYNLNWKNPDSVTIHECTSSINGDNVIVYIDYSAQNGFGGYNRETYCIAVDRKTGSITGHYSF